MQYTFFKYRLTQDILVKSQEQGEHLKNLPRSRPKRNFLTVEIDSSLIYKMLTVFNKILKSSKNQWRLYLCDFSVIWICIYEFIIALID